MYKVIELNEHIENTGQNLKGRIGDDDEYDITVSIDNLEFYPHIADLKQLVRFLNRVIKEAS